MRVECINDSFVPEWIIYFATHGIITPIKGNEYTVREIVKYPDGTVGYLLEEIRNAPTPRISKFSPDITGSAEQTWDSKRFKEVSAFEFVNSRTQRDLKCQHDWHTFFNKGYRKCNKCGEEYCIKF